MDEVTFSQITVVKCVSLMRSLSKPCQMPRGTGSRKGGTHDIGLDRAALASRLASVRILLTTPQDLVCLASTREQLVSSDA